MNTPLLNIGPGGDFTRDHLLVEPVSDDAKSHSYQVHVIGPEGARLHSLHVRLRARRVNVATACCVCAAGVASALISLPGAAWLAVGLGIAGFYVRFHPGRS